MKPGAGRSWASPPFILMRTALLLLSLIVLPSLAQAADPSWFSVHADSVEVHVPNIIVQRGERIELSHFVSVAGLAYAKSQERPGDYVVLPLLLIGGNALDSDCEFRVFLRDGDGVETRLAIDGMWTDGTQYPVRRADGKLVVSSLAVFERFRLKDVVGFSLRNGGVLYRLVQESELR